ncbi:hypothetical protein RJ641_009294 [Dillenia turbinata]|uniref:Uncharacterized protein n=1 Tax=Dillenia turbinata TaxID=194707 RepID=A0AAN8UXT7_9MAGN
MDQSWRPRPIQEPRFGPDTNHSFHRPYFDSCNDYKNWGNHNLPETVHRNPNFAGDSVNVVNNGYHRFEHDRLGLNSGDFSGNDRTSKRFKVDDMGSGLAVNGNWQNQSGALSDDSERRLKLIRDHDNSFLDINLRASASGKYVEFDGSRNVGHNTVRYEMNQCFGSYDLEGAFVHSELHGISCETHEKREFWRDEHKHIPSRRDDYQSDMDQSYGGNRNGGFLHPLKEEFQQFRYGQTENSFRLPSQNYGSYGPNSVGHDQNTQETHAAYQTEGAYQNEQWVKRQYPGMEKDDINQQPHMSQNINSCENEFPSDNYCSHNIKQLQGKDSTQYSHRSHSQVLPGSTAMYVQPYALMRFQKLFRCQILIHSIFSLPFLLLPPPLPMSPQDPPLAVQRAPSPPKTSVTLFPVPTGSASGLSSYASISEGHSFIRPLLHSTTHAWALFGPKYAAFCCFGVGLLLLLLLLVSHSFHQTPVKHHLGHCQQFPLRNQSSDKPKAVDASQLFLQPHQATLPDHIVIILRGLPGPLFFTMHLCSLLFMMKFGFQSRSHALCDIEVYSNSLSGLLQAYNKEGKSVHWGDQVANTGFSIGARRKTTTYSLVIGPGAGYNLKSNPLPEDENPIASKNKGEPRRKSVFQE